MIRDAYSVEVTGFTRYAEYSFMYKYYDLSATYFRNRLHLAVL